MRLFHWEVNNDWDGNGFVTAAETNEQAKAEIEAHIRSIYNKRDAEALIKSFRKRGIIETFDSVMETNWCIG